MYHARVFLRHPPVAPSYFGARLLYCPCLSEWRDPFLYDSLFDGAGIPGGSPQVVLSDAFE